MYKFLKFAALSLLLQIGASTLTPAFAPAWAEGTNAVECLPGVLDAIMKDAYEPSQRVVDEMTLFANEFNLPTKIVEVGPAERRVKRMFVALDYNRPELVQAYLDRFNIDKPLGGDHQATLALEFANEVPGEYVTGVFRPSANPDAQIYRWGRPDLTRSNWFKTWLQIPRGGQDLPIKGYSHLLGLSAPEAANFKTFLENPDLRAPCKSDNCVAWTSSIELGKTAAGATDAERQFLFSQLGVSRSMAHFEIGRRLVHAADQRHAAIVAFVNGQAGLDAFEHITDHLPPLPKIPFANIIKGVVFAQDSEASKAVAQIPDGAKIFIPIAAGASPEGVNALVERSMTLQKGFDVHVLVNGISENAFRQGIETTNGKFRVMALFLGGNLRALHREGKVAVIPGYLGDFTRWVRDPKQTTFHYDAMVVRVSPPDANGKYSLGPNNDMIMTILRDRPGIKVIAEVNPNVPHTTGDNFLTEAQITAKFSATTELAGPPVVPMSDVEAAIGKNVGALIDDGATLQVGIGNIFGGLPDGLAAAGRQNLSIWSEMFGDPLKQVMERGIAHKATVGFAYGSQDLYKWLDHNPNVVFSETEHVNSPAKVMLTPKFHAVNTALQVDLHGNVNATQGAAGDRISSPGGQVEFMAGAAKSEGGKAIIAIRSTAKNETISTITLKLYDGPVTTPHESVTHVVTEYGTAHLAGKTESQRAIELIKIAHPKFRAGLIKEAVDFCIITAEEATHIPLN